MSSHIPRKSLRLVGDPASPRRVNIRAKLDVTGRMLKWARKWVGELEKEGLPSYIFKSNPPGSGVQRVGVCEEKGIPAKQGVGILARAFIEHLPLLPIEDAGRLHDPGLRKSFTEHVFSLKRWRDAIAEDRSRGKLVGFHADDRLRIMAHIEKRMRTMGKLHCRRQEPFSGELYERCQSLFLEALGLRSAIHKNCNVFQHVMGLFKKRPSSDEKQELLEAIPVTLVSHYERKQREPYLMSQTYLRPHPSKLALRNHVQALW